MFLVILFAVLALITSALPYIFAPTLSPLWLILFVPLEFVGWNLLFLLVLLLSTAFLPGGAKAERNLPWCRRVIGPVMRWLFAVLNCSVRVIGYEKVPKCPCVFVSNHLSDFDPMAVLATVRDRPLVYISKESNFRIPIAGPYIRHAGFLALDREHPLRAARTIKEGARLVREEGLTVGIYPEGTRSRTGELLPFKEGAFVLAKKADAPIVLMVTPNTEKVAKGLPFRRRIRITVEYIDVVPREKVEELTAAELATYCRDRIAAHLAGK